MSSSPNLHSNESHAAILLLPGLFAGDWIWQSTCHELLKAGYLFSTVRDAFASVPARGRSLDSLRSVVDCAVDDLPARKVVVCGNSIGALLALDLAHRRRDKVVGLILSGCPGLGESINLGVRACKQFTVEDMRPIASRVFFDAKKITQEMLLKTFHYFLERNSRSNIARYLLAARDVQISEIVRNISVPTFLLWGENDIVTPVDPWLPFARSPFVRLEAIPECGHSPMIECPREFNSRLVDFLNSISGEELIRNRTTAEEHNQVTHS